MPSCSRSGGLVALLLLPLVAFVTFAAAAGAACSTTSAVVPSTGKSWKSYAAPAVGMGQGQGWSSIPSGAAVCAADLVRDFKVTSSGDTVPYWVTNEVKGSVDRAVVVLAGKNRDGWSYFNLMRNARNRAAATYPDEIKRTQIAIYTPMIFTRADKAAGAASATDAYWAGDDWASGRAAMGPSEAATGLSSFEVMDRLIDEIKAQHPAVRDIVFAGHSMSAQFVNRYSAMKTSPDDGVRVSYWIGNPGSWLWMETQRPVAGSGKCAGYDKYKYGLSDSIPAYARQHYRSSGERSGALQRLLQRNVHVRVGARDFGPGDVRCQAKLQGANHRERGTNYKNSIAALNGGKLPAGWNFEVVPGCSHDNECMFNGNLRTLFLGQSDAAVAPAAGAKTKTKTKAKKKNTKRSRADEGEQGAEDIVAEIEEGVLRRESEVRHRRRGSAQH
ncbi:uncharacterized protein PFL1_01960 [Pseudozyma flocculosa PF-1]|uniref:Uncharacterized protein n=1 Tax=Pseudozyma flocculosa TaxID=84751 RepID=A0A5C3EZK4_9BASI|nr:uncharacterized protein PFL1_01960 [Pseudozyma flocculosa PF-1]EPQ30434.1 hypothetical protein PFL1_01960 [Pseudozyma flocculosa PF-1]SPO37512.1 uncharacterized protein PSFLO_02987 [Pseudozyma flocculosa]